jgi:DNA damage-binding protein 1
MGDGHLFTFRMKLSADKLSADLLDKRSVALGTQPITLSTFATKGITNVFAACDRPTVLYSSSRKLLFSNVNQPQVTYMSPFHSQSFPDCLALASESGLLIGK